MLSPIKLIIGALAAMTAALISSRLGDKGTLIGTGLVSIIIGVATAGYEYLYKKAHAGLKRVGPLAAIQEEPGTPKTKGPQARRLSRSFWIPALATTAVVGTVGFGFIAVTEASSGKTLHGLTTGTNDYGSSFGHSSTTPPAPTTPTTPTTPSPVDSRATRTPLPSQSVTSISPTATASIAPSRTQGTSPSPTYSNPPAPDVSPTPIITSSP